MSPRAGRGSDTRRRIVVDDRVDVRPEPVGCDGGRAGERGEGSLGGDEGAMAQRSELTDCHAVARHDKGLAAIERAHDVTAAVPQLPLGDLSGHDQNVARVLRRGRLTHRGHFGLE
jgi:hypothetical protein